MKREEIVAELFRLQDKGYAALQKKIIPTAGENRIIGVRTPDLRSLAKQYPAVLPYLEEQRLDAWTHNMAIRKSVESRSLTPEQKACLKALKVKRSPGGSVPKY